MSNHSIGTFAALLILGCLFSLASITLFPTFSYAQLSELSEIQSGVFHLSHKNTGINAETFANDQYIDEDQANFIASASRSEPFTPADDNYPFTLVDHYILDSDLEIVYKDNNGNQSVTCPTYSPYPKTAYLSRHNISYADYTDRKSPPDKFFNVIKGTDPYSGEKVTAVYMKVTNYEVTVPEMRTKHPLSSWEAAQREACLKSNVCVSGPCKCLPKSDIPPRKICTPAEGCYSGWVYNTYVRVDSASVWVWTRKNDTDLMKRCAPAPPKVSSCLPPSASRRISSQPKVNTCLPPSAIRPRTIPEPTCANLRAGLISPSINQSSKISKADYSTSVVPCRT
jgi:hypothetical protein